MVFSSPIFMFLFLPLVLIGYYNPLLKIGNSTKNRNVFLLMASLLFYAWGEPLFVFLMIISIIVTWYLGLVVEKTKSSVYLIIGISYHVAILFVFKYLNFFMGEIAKIIHVEMKMCNLELPLGISFFTFQLMSYLFDIYYKTAKAQKNCLNVGLYISLFPQLVAGPIVRYQKIEDDLLHRSDNAENVIKGMKRFIYGLGKKVLIANYVAQVADNMFDYMVGNTSVLMAWLGAICYTLQIYFDFSGYSDMAIGLGCMFGFEFDENFNYPYIAKSVTDFWRRWHISLSSWFRDYVYIPMGGNRVSKRRWILNMFIVWLLTGMWHGANWTFILWGMLYWIVLMLEKNTHIKFDVPGFIKHGYTLLVVIIAWVVFRAKNISVAWLYIKNMFGINATDFAGSLGTYLEGIWFVLFIAIIGCTPIVKLLFEWFKKKGLGWLEPIWVGGIFALSIFQVVSATYNPFIYFNF